MKPGLIILCFLLLYPLKVIGDNQELIALEGIYSGGSFAGKGCPNKPQKFKLAYTRGTENKITVGASAWAMVVSGKYEKDKSFSLKGMLHQCTVDGRKLSGAELSMSCAIGSSQCDFSGYQKE